MYLKKPTLAPRFVITVPAGVRVKGYPTEQMRIVQEGFEKEDRLVA